LYESKPNNISSLMELERELMRRERQIEYLQMEIKRYHGIVEELKQGMRPVGAIEEVRGEHAYVRLAGGQVFQATIPQELASKVTANCNAVLSPTKGVVVDVVEKPKEKSIWDYKVERAPQVSYEDVVGLDDELMSFRKAVEWVLDPRIRRKRERLIRDRRLLEEAGSVLLFGPPGSGKTLMAKALAGTISKQGQQTSFVKIEGYEVVSKWLGESAKNVKEIFNLAREVAPTILFIDEADAIARARMETTTDAGRDVQGMLNQFLIELGEGFDVSKNLAIVFATNLPIVMDPALMDRIRKAIYVPPPKSREAVKRFFSFYLSKVRVDPEIMEGKELAEGVFEEIWSVVRRRKHVFETSIPRRGIRVRDEYSITPRGIKNVVQEAANDASFRGFKHVNKELLLENVGRFIEQEGALIA